MLEFGIPVNHMVDRGSCFAAPGVRRRPGAARLLTYVACDPSYAPRPARRKSFHVACPPRWRGQPSQSPPRGVGSPCPVCTLTSAERSVIGRAQSKMNFIQPKAAHLQALQAMRRQSH